MVDQLHLFQNGGLQSRVSENSGNGSRCYHLARLSSSEQKHLNLVFGHHAVFFELALDLVISCDSAEIISPSVGEVR